MAGGEIQPGLECREEQGAARPAGDGSGLSVSSGQEGECRGGEKEASATQQDSRPGA